MVRIFVLNEQIDAFMSFGLAQCPVFIRLLVKLKLNLETVLTPLHDLSPVCEPENKAN